MKKYFWTVIALLAVGATKILPAPRLQSRAQKFKDEVKDASKVAGLQVDKSAMAQSPPSQSPPPPPKSPPPSPDTSPPPPPPPSPKSPPPPPPPESS